MSEEAQCVYLHLHLGSVIMIFPIKMKKPEAVRWEKLEGQGDVPKPNQFIADVKNLCTPMFIAALFTIAKCWKQPKCPSVNEWIKKLWYIYTMEFYTAERKKELIPFATAWMELESIMLSEISQAVKDKYHMISPLTGT